VAELLFDAAVQGIHALYARRLLASFAASPTPAPAPEATGDWIEPLSEREVEVLRLIADGLTNREIAERLYLAPTTVKVHARNIFGKLGAANRTQA
jgi:LuxR family maltose regulon positive regulatory protein